MSQNENMALAGRQPGDIHRQIMDYETFQTGWFSLLNDYKDPQSP